MFDHAKCMAYYPHPREEWVAKILKDKIVKCRKGHDCVHCAAPIQIGDEARVVVILDDCREIYQAYHCRFCCFAMTQGTFDDRFMCESTDQMRDYV